MFEKNIIDERQYKFSLLEPLPKKINYFENKTPQFSQFIKNKFPENNIKTSLDYKLQKKVEKLVKSYSNSMKQIGIYNATTMVVDNKTKEVLIYVASQNFEDKKNSGEIDGLQVKRSPASLLKPFLYALAIDDGLIINESLYPDVPIYFNNFYPKNSDNKFRGMVRMEEALIKSLNIPFIKLLEDYKVDRFFYFLENIDKYRDDNFEKYGLSLILGTREMRAVDIVKLYSGLANYGDFSDLKYKYESRVLTVKDFETSNKKESRKLLSSGASFLTLETLSKVVRPDNEKLYSEEKPISWKTGTSFGLRDAWAVGTSLDYTILVWLGNFSNKPIASLSGVDTAGNLLFKVFNIVDMKPKKFIKPLDDLKEIQIDIKTGYRKFYNTESKIIDFPKSSKLLRISPYLKKIFVDKNNNEVDSRNDNFVNAKEKIIIEYPVEVSNYFYYLDEIFVNKNVKIAYPTNNLEITLPKDFLAYQKLAIKLYNPNKEFVYWYIDGKYLGLSNEEERFFDLEDGLHRFTIVTEDGVKEEVIFKVNKK